MSLANKFTFSRVLCAPLFFVLYFSPEWFGLNPLISVCLLLPLLAYAEFSDFLDGFYARKMKEVSDFGKIFDPFGDVLLHITTFFCFALSGYMPKIILILIFYREFTMLFLRLMATREGVAIAARKGGKLKTVLYIAAGFFSLFIECAARCGLVFAENTMGIFKIVSIILYVIALIAAYVSFADYLVHFKDLFKKQV